MISAEADIHTYPGPEGNPYAPIEAPLPEDMLKSMKEGDRARFSNDISIDMPQGTPLWIQMSPGELPPAVDSQSSGNPKMESYLADVRQLYTIPNLRAEAFQDQHDVLMRLYPGLFPARPEVTADAPIPVEPEPEVGQASIFGPAILGLLGGKGRVKAASLIAGVSLLAAQCAPLGPGRVEPSVPPPGATIQIAETATPNLVPTEMVIPPVPTEDVISGQAGVEAFSVVPGLPAGFGGEGEQDTIYNSQIVQDALVSKGYAPIVYLEPNEDPNNPPRTVLSNEQTNGDVAVAVLNHPDQIFNPDVSEGADVLLRTESGLVVYGGPGADGVIGTGDDVERKQVLTAVSLTGYPDSVTSVAAVVNDPDNPNWGAIDVLLIDETSGEILGTMPAVFAGTDNVTASWDDSGLTTRVNGEAITFALTRPLPTETPPPTEVVVQTIREQLDAWTTEDLSNESTVETASGTYTFNVAVSSEVAKMGGLIKFTVDDTTQNDAMLYTLARLWHWEDKLGGEGKSPENNFGGFASTDLTDQPQEFIQAMRSVNVRPTTDILNHQTTYSIEGTLPRQEISGIHIMVVTEEQLGQVKTQLQKDGTPYMKVNRDALVGGIMKISPEDQEFIVFNDNGILRIVFYNHVNGIGYADRSIGLESPNPDISQSLKFHNRDTFNYARVVDSLYNYPFKAFEEWKDDRNRTWVGQELLFGIKGNKEPFEFPESTPQLQVEFADS